MSHQTFQHVLRLGAFAAPTKATLLQELSQSKVFPELAKQPAAENF
jgi:hypothetical protein